MPNLCFAQHRWRAAIPLLVALCAFRPPLAAQVPATGALVGRVMSTTTGEAIAGATVRLESLDRATLADLNGAFRFDDLPGGTYTITAESDAFRRSVVTDLVVVAGATVRYNVPLTPVTAAVVEATPSREGDEVIQLESLMVRADVTASSDLGLLATRQKAAAVSDSIGSDSMTRLGFTDAASAMRSVTGASVIGDKYVLIRGMGDRYGSTALNGAEIPSADPDRRAVQLDLFNAHLIDAIVTTKTFTPDRPGSFAGGTVDIRTKTVPDQRTVSLAAGVSYNTAMTGEPVLGGSGATNWLGRDAGVRELPAEIAALDGFPARFTETDAEIGRLARLFSPTMAPRETDDAKPNRNFSFSYGDRWSSRAGVFGVLASTTFDRSISGYLNGRFARNDLQSTNAPELAPLIDLADTKQVQETNAGGLLRLGWQPSAQHELGYTFLANSAAEDIARVQSGTYLAGGGLDGDQVYTTRTLWLIERAVRSHQFNGKHRFPGVGNLLIEWQAARSSNEQDEPDVRFFSTAARDNEGAPDYIWSTSGVPQPQRYFRTLHEDRDEAQLDFTLPVRLADRWDVKLKAGVLAARIDRAFGERSFSYLNAGSRFFNGDDQTFFAPEHVGTVGANGRFITDTVYMVETTAPRNSYDGRATLRSSYLMGDVALSPQLRVIAGARVEDYEMDVVSHDPQEARGTLDNRDVLPALNVVYALSESTNLRAAYGRTLARPNFREKAPFRSYVYQGGSVKFGNPDLERTLIDNFDLRWEWFRARRDLVAVSLFYKRLQNPIEETYYAPTGVIINEGELTWQNQESGTVYGVEFEAHQSLAPLGDWLRHISVGGNFTWTHSEVPISEGELVTARSLNSEVEDTRPLAGQSPYLANFDLSYQNLERGTGVSIYYNVFGERLAVVAPPGTPDIYEQPMPTLDVVVRQRFAARWLVTFKASNLLDPVFEETQRYRGVEYVRSSFHKGRTFSLSLGFDY